MQRQRNVAGAVGQVESDRGACRPCRPRNPFKVEHLAGGVLHAGPQHQRDGVAFCLQEGFDVGLFDAAVAAIPQFAAGSKLHQAFRGIQAVEPDLGRHCVTVGGEGLLFDDDTPAPAPGPVEADHHQVQVDRQ